MNKVQKQKDEGFTIIEVVLVLAIAALIMLMVFIALPALQRNQRDTTRKNDVSRLQSAINNYKSRNRGSLPQSTSTAPTYAEFFASDLRKNGDQFADPSGGDYVAEVRTTGTPNNPDYSDSTAANIYIFVGGTCSGENASGSLSSGARKVAIVKPLEGGGRHCAEA
jgi:prepilin-type N-terminal cleavage/methylation domain-containing protein